MGMGMLAPGFNKFLFTVVLALPTVVLTMALVLMGPLGNTFCGSGAPVFMVVPNFLLI
jgi:hypothetical protein